MRKYIKEILQMFFVINTGVTIAAATFITFLENQAQLNVKILWQIIIVSFVTALSCIILYSKNELNKKQFLIRVVINYITINIIVIVCGYLFNWIKTGDIIELLSLIVSIFLVYIFVWVISYKNDTKTAKRINQKIEEYNKELSSNK